MSIHLIPRYVVTVAALVSGVLSVVATSLIAVCILCLVVRGSRERKVTSPGVQDVPQQGSELVEYEVPVLRQEEQTIRTEHNVAYEASISLKQNVAYEKVHSNQH